MHIQTLLCISRTVERGSYFCRYFAGHEQSKGNLSTAATAVTPR